MQTRGKVKLVFIIYECTMNIKIWQSLLIPSHLCPGVPSRIHPPLPGIIPPISLTEEGKTVLTNTWLQWWVTLCYGPCGWFTRGCCQKKQVAKSGTASQCSGEEVCLQNARLAHPRTPTPSLWCLCVFVNEEILVPWWDIAVSWADSGSSVPSAPAQSYRRPTQPQSHQASGWLSLTRMELLQKLKSWYLIYIYINIEYAKTSRGKKM